MPRRMPLGVFEWGWVLLTTLIQRVMLMDQHSFKQLALVNLLLLGSCEESAGGGQGEAVGGKLDAHRACA